MILYFGTTWSDGMLTVVGYPAVDLERSSVDLIISSSNF